MLARGEADDEAELTAMRTEAALLADQAPDERGAALLAELERAQADHTLSSNAASASWPASTRRSICRSRACTRSPPARSTVCPSRVSPRCRTCTSRQLDRERERRDALEHLSLQTSELAQVEAELTALLAGEDLPDPAQLTELRRRRDETWTLVRQQLLARGGTPQRDLFSPPAEPGDLRARPPASATAAPSPAASSARSPKPTCSPTACAPARTAWPKGQPSPTPPSAPAWHSLAPANAWPVSTRPSGHGRPNGPSCGDPPASHPSPRARCSPGSATRPPCVTSPPPACAANTALAPLRPQVRDFEARLREHLAASSSPTSPSHAAYPSSATSHAPHFAAAASTYSATSPQLAWPALVSQLRERERVAQTRRGRLESTQARATSLAAALARTGTGPRLPRARPRDSAADDLRRRTAALGLAADLDPETAVERLEALADLSERLASNEQLRNACEQALAGLATFDAEVDRPAPPPRPQPRRRRPTRAAGRAPQSSARRSPLGRQHARPRPRRGRRQAQRTTAPRQRARRRPPRVRGPARPRRRRATNLTFWPCPNGPCCATS